MHCDEILKQGVFNEIIVNTNRSVSDNLYEWLKRVDYGTFSNAQSAGLEVGLPIAGVPIAIKGSFSESEFNNWKHEVNTGRGRNFTESEEYNIIRRSASPDIVEAWQRCIIDTQGVGLVSDLEKNEPYFTFTVRYSPIGLEDKLPVVSTNGFQVMGATCNVPIKEGTVIGYRGLSVILRRVNQEPIIVILNTTRGTVQEQVPALVIVHEPVLPALNIRKFVEVYPDRASQYPELRLEVPPGYKIISGGARDIWQPFVFVGNLLTESYPEGDRVWVAKGKDHLEVSPGYIEVAVLAINDPEDEWEVVTRSDTSAGDIARASLPQGYLLTGGGGQAIWHGFGRLLTASFPADSNTWEVRAKAHGEPDYGATVAHVIGIRPRNGAKMPEMLIDSSSPSQSGGPDGIETRYSVPGGWRMLGGGALVEYSGPGVLLTDSYAESENTWYAKGKAHMYEDYSGSIRAYAIYVKEQ